MNSFFKIDIFNLFIFYLISNSLRFKHHNRKVLFSMFSKLWAKNDTFTSIQLSGSLNMAKGSITVLQNELIWLLLD